MPTLRQHQSTASAELHYVITACFVTKLCDAVADNGGMSTLAKCDRSDDVYLHCTCWRLLTCLVGQLVRKLSTVLLLIVWLECNVPACNQHLLAYLLYLGSHQASTSCMELAACHVSLAMTSFDIRSACQFVQSLAL